ncbi:MAG: hypothetical protein QNJ40_15580 [Xanthomonadales bacterium]|nr:hypothetical protein [Xanthomonadales bacterium]
MDTPESPQPAAVPVVALSVLHVLFLMAVPVLANIALVPVIDGTWHVGLWFFFGLLGIPIAFAGMMAFNPFPRSLPAALIRTLTLPVAVGAWWWVQGGSLTGYFAAMLVFEFLAVFLSIFLMCFLPMSWYDPTNPEAGNWKTYINVLVLQGSLAAGFSAALILSVWPWLVQQTAWAQPVTYVILGLAILDYMVSHFQWHRRHAGRHRRLGQLPVADDPVSIEPLLLFTPVLWLMTFVYLAP